MDLDGLTTSLSLRSVGKRIYVCSGRCRQVFGGDEFRGVSRRPLVKVDRRVGAFCLSVRTVSKGGSTVPVSSVGLWVPDLLVSRMWRGFETVLVRRSRHQVPRETLQKRHDTVVLSVVGRSPERYRGIRTG